MTGFSESVAHQTELSIWVIVGRLALAAALGGIIGLEREWRHRAAGLRTHMLVSLAAAVFSVMMLEILHNPDMQRDWVRVDPVRIIEAVTAGVAFLAAGAIIQSRGGVKGLTTGAGLWLAGAVGSTTGLGYAQIGIAAALLGLVIMALLRLVEPNPAKKKQPDEDPRS